MLNHINFLSLFLIHTNILDIAIADDIAAWSEGNGASGIWSNIRLFLDIATCSGLCLSINNCINKLSNTDEIQEKNIYNAISL